MPPLKLLGCALCVFASCSLTTTPAAPPHTTTEALQFLTRHDPAVSQRLSTGALPWKTSDVGADSLALPPGFRHLEARLPGRASEAVAVAADDAQLRLLPVGARATALTLDGARAHFPEAFTDTDTDTVLLAGTEWVEQLWVLRSAQAPTPSASR
jgi:hypothetical protein